VFCTYTHAVAGSTHNARTRVTAEGR
jgi:hypothetical protein